MFMLKWTISLLVAAFLSGCASIESQTTSYNKGVTAYQQKNYVEARRYWEQSIAEGQPSDALNNLGFLLFHGLGGAPEPERAVSLWQKGAILGVSEAQWHLGAAYGKGQGTQRNYPMAYAWFRCAVANAESATGPSKSVEEGVAKGARRSLEVLLDRLTPEEFESGRRFATEYIEKYGKRIPSKP